MNHWTFDGGVGDFEKIKKHPAGILAPKKQFMYMTTSEKIHACPKKHIPQFF